MTQKKMLNSCAVQTAGNWLLCCQRMLCPMYCVLAYACHNPNASAFVLLWQMQKNFEDKSLA